MKKYSSTLCKQCLGNILKTPEISKVHVVPYRGPPLLFEVVNEMGGSIKVKEIVSKEKKSFFPPAIVLVITV